MPALGRLLHRLDHRLYRACRALGIAALGAVVLIALAQVLSRYLLRKPLVWSEELATYLFIWLSMLGAAMAVHTKAHYGFEMLARRAPRALQAAIEAVVLLVCIAVSVAIGWLGSQMALGARDTSASLGIGMAWFYLAMPFGAWAMCVHFAARLASLGGFGPVDRDAA